MSDERTIDLSAELNAVSASSVRLVCFDLEQRGACTACLLGDVEWTECNLDERPFEQHYASDPAPKWCPLRKQSVLISGGR